MTNNLITLRHLQKNFRQGGASIPVLRDVNLTLPQGSMTALLGPSGAGKSTLLHIIGLLDAPSGGSLHIQDRPISHRHNDSEHTALRRHFFGFVYQYHHLLSEFTALENVMLPLLLCGAAHKEAKMRAAFLLHELHCDHRAHHLPAQLSGGEQQRVALARGLAHHPTMLIADEPTGNLDPSTAEDVFALLLRHIKEHKMTLLVATHNRHLASHADAVYHLREGVLTPEGVSSA